MARTQTTSQAKVTPTTSESGNLTSASGGGKLAVTSTGVTDVTIESCDSVSIEALKSRPDLQMTVGQATSSEIGLEKVQANLRLAIAKQKTVQLGIKERTEQQRTAELAFDYSTQVSHTMDAQNEAEFAEEQRLLRAQIRESNLTILNAKVIETGAKADVAQQKATAYQETYGQSNTTKQSSEGQSRRKSRGSYNADGYVDDAEFV
ncbi:MAG: hypothetical protein PUP93_26565 [Rhizonema sp. NSF051]|nr:hypothetical protein [Rhizonema sp. NSF051]